MRVTPTLVVPETPPSAAKDFVAGFFPEPGKPKPEPLKQDPHVYDKMFLFMERASKIAGVKAVTVSGSSTVRVWMRVNHNGRSALRELAKIHLPSYVTLQLEDLEGAAQ